MHQLTRKLQNLKNSDKLYQEDKHNIPTPTLHSQSSASLTSLCLRSWGTFLE